MKSGVNNAGVVNYDSISKEIRSLYDNVETFKNWRVSTVESFKSFSASLANIKLNHPFPMMEKEINETIGRWNVSVPLDKLRLQLDGYFSKIAFIDQEIGKIETLQQKLLQYPDRHNRKAVTDKIIVFSQNVNKTSLSQLDKICNDVIPNVHKMIEAVFLGFSDEDNNVENNKKSARNLKTRIDGYGKYVDRFNLRQICAEASRVANQILQTPNMANPNSDAIKLKQASQSLDQCIAQFKAEQKKYDDLKQLLSDNLCHFWIDDSAPLMKELEDGACFNETPASQLKAKYDKVVGVKEKEISQAMSGFSAKIRSYFSNDILELRDSQRDRQNFRNLIARMNRKAEEERKRFIIKVIKYIGIAIAIGILIWVIVAFVIPWVSENWPWIVLGLVIIGFIVYKIVKDN